MQLPVACKGQKIQKSLSTTVIAGLMESFLSCCQLERLLLRSLLDKSEKKDFPDGFDIFKC
jgi:hypothetical protein